MELDDLKQTWKQTSNSKQTLKKDIMEFIQQPQYGPVAALKKEFRKQIAAMILATAFIITTTINGIADLRYNFLFWSYMAFCAGVIVFHFINYRIVRRMELMDGDVRSNLQKQINILETRLKWKRIFLPLVALFFFALVEILPAYQHFRMLDKWHALPVMTRIASYAGFLLLQYFANKWVTWKKFGSHLEYLKKLIKELE
jgi:hypothetical protein